MAEINIVRENLLSRPGYSPYCGKDKCRYRWPRTDWDGRQFTCKCGWRSEFPREFIERYLEYRKEWV